MKIHPSILDVSEPEDERESTLADLKEEDKEEKDMGKLVKENEIGG